jgi:hypothetical protein
MIDDAIRNAVERLFVEAKEHRYVLEQMAADPACADEPVGFHACRTAQKLLEAVLCLASVPYQDASDLSMLIDLVLANTPRALPDELNLEEARPLSAFAQGDEAYLEESPTLNRCRVLNCVRVVQRWAESTRDSLDPETPERRQMREEIERDRQAVEVLLNLRVSRTEPPGPAGTKGS